MAFTKIFIPIWLLAVAFWMEDFNHWIQTYISRALVYSDLFFDLQWTNNYRSTVLKIILFSILFSIPERIMSAQWERFLEHQCTSLYFNKFETFSKVWQKIYCDIFHYFWCWCFWSSKHLSINRAFWHWIMY